MGGLTIDFDIEVEQDSFVYRVLPPPEFTDDRISAENQMTQSVAEIKIVKSKELEDQFARLADRWERETGFYSSPTKRCAHEDYKSIVKMGKPAIGLILSRMRKKPGNWFVALAYLAKTDAAKDTHTFDEAIKAWLDWGKQQGHIS